LKKCGGFGFGEKQWPLYNAKCCCDEQLRRSTNDAQIEEIRRLKQQLALKDRRIHELEEQLQRYKNSFIGDSTAWWAEQLASVKTPSPGLSRPISRKTDAKVPSLFFHPCCI
jgi:hypothetical protein